MPLAAWVFMAGMATPGASENALSWDLTHGYSPAEAAARMGYLLTYWRERFGIELRGTAPDITLSGKICGFGLAARIQFRPHHIHATLVDPGWPVRAPVSRYIEGMLRKYLHPTYANEDRSPVAVSTGSPPTSAPPFRSPSTDMGRD